MQNGVFKAALLAGVLAFSFPAVLQAQTDEGTGSDSSGQPSSVGPEVTDDTAGQAAAPAGEAAPAEENDGCPTGALGTDESAASTDTAAAGTGDGTDADLTNCAENEPADEPADSGSEGTPDEGGAGGTNEQGSDDAGNGG